jgi:hypothetical protein
MGGRGRDVEEPRLPVLVLEAPEEADRVTPYEVRGRGLDPALPAVDVEPPVPVATVERDPPIEVRNTVCLEVPSVEELADQCPLVAGVSEVARQCRALVELVCVVVRKDAVVVGVASRHDRSA